MVLVDASEYDPEDVRRNARQKLERDPDETD